MFNKTNKIEYIIVLSLFCVVLYFPFFLHLDSLPIQPWDEALFGIRALFFAETGSFITNFAEFEGLESYGNSKPPFFTIIQALSLKVLGYNELALRLPTALCSLLISFLLLFIGYKECKNIWFGILAALVYATSLGVAADHMGRYGDQDIPFALAILVLFYSFYKYLKHFSIKYLLIALVSFTIALFIKSVAVFLVLPSFILWIYFKRKIIIKKLSWKIVIMVLSLISVGLFFMIQNESFGIGNWNRLLITADNHSEGFWHYFDVWIFENHFTPWILFFPIAAFFSIKEEKVNQQELIFFAFAFFLTFMLILSISATKLFWYAAPLFPIASLIAAYGLWKLLQIVFDSISFKSSCLKKTCFYSSLILIFALPYIQVIEKVAYPKESDAISYWGIVLKNIEKNHPEIKDIQFIYEGFNPVANFYHIAYEKEKNYSISRKYYFKNINSFPTYVIVESEKLKNTAEVRYNFEIIEEYENFQLLKLKNEK